MVRLFFGSFWIGQSGREPTTLVGDFVCVVPTKLHMYFIQWITVLKIEV